MSAARVREQAEGHARVSRATEGRWQAVAKRWLAGGVWAYCCARDCPAGGRTGTRCRRHPAAPPSLQPEPQSPLRRLRPAPAAAGPAAHPPARALVHPRPRRPYARLCFVCTMMASSGDIIITSKAPSERGIDTRCSEYTSSACSTIPLPACTYRNSIAGTSPKSRNDACSPSGAADD